MIIGHFRKYHNIPHCSLFFTSTFCISIVFNFSWELKWPREKLKTMLMQNFGVTNKEYYGMLWYFLVWSIASITTYLIVYYVKIAKLTTENTPVF